MSADNPTVVIIGIFICVFLILAVLGFAFGLFGGRNKILAQRLNQINKRHKKSAAGIMGERKSLFIKQEKSILDQFIPKPEELRKRLKKTGHDISFKNYVYASLGLAFVGFLGVKFLGGMPLMTALMLGLLIGAAIPHLVVSSMIKKRVNKFVKQFPEAIDLIVRGLKAGLPVTESIQAVSSEMENPISEEFGRITDDIRLGKTLDEALWKCADRLDTAEFKFFVISLSVQQETGGNLAETLENLSNILRGRQQLDLKIKALSSEGKASAYILGSLPFIMAGIISVMNYEYISILFTDPRGHIAIIGGVVWMGIGMFILTKMINFEY